MCSKAPIIPNQNVLPFLIDYLPEFAIKKCNEELNESPEGKQKALQELRCLIQKNEKTRGIKFHEDLLIQYLRRNKYRIQDSFQHLHNYVVLNKKESSIFEKVADHHFEAVSSKYMLLLPKRCPDGCTIVIFQIGRWDPKVLSFECFKKIVMMVFLQLLRDPMNQINGFKFIHDFKGTLFFLKYCTPRNFYLLYNTAVNCLPGRWKEIHFIHESVAMKTLGIIMRPFLSLKMKSRILFHSDTNELFDYFPRSVIPPIYGGTLQEPDLGDWIRKANMEHRQYSIEGQPNFYSS